MIRLIPESPHIHMPTLMKSLPSFMDMTLRAISQVSLGLWSRSIAIFCHLHLASQMWELLHIFPFIVYNVLTLDDPHFSCFMLLTEISSVLFSGVIAKDQVPYLRIIIKQYLEQFKTLYPHRPLTPKCHYLVHTPSLIKRYSAHPALYCLLVV